MRLLKFTLFLIASMPLAGCKQNRKLSDDLSWMNNTYNPNDGNGGIGQGKSGWYVPSRNSGTEKFAAGTIQTFASDGCQITTWTEDDPSAEAREMYTFITLRFNLHDIDPGTVKLKTFSHNGGLDCGQFSAEEREAMQLDCDHAELVARTRNASADVEEDYHAVYPKLTGPEHDTYSKSKSSEVYFEIGNVDYANHFATAFRDAVIQCGGTKGAGN